jgi:hypothetical protein
MAAAVAFPVPTTRTVPSGASEGFPRAGRSGRSAGERHRPPVPAPSRVASRRHRSVAVYRRRRFVAAALGVGIVLVAGQAAAALGGSPLAPVERRPQVHAEQVVVEPGDTLWSIAKRVAPDRDPREVVDALVQARGTAALLPGETVTWLDS